MSQNHQQIENEVSPKKPQGGRAVEPDQQLAQMRVALKKNLNRQIQFMRNSCVRCGLCADACHYSCLEDDEDLIPANKLETLSKVLHKYFHPAQSLLPGFKSDLPPDAVLYRARTFRIGAPGGKCVSGR